MKNINYILLKKYWFISLFFIFACKKNSNNVVLPDNPNENEIITTVQLKCINESNKSEVIKFTFKDPDGTGGIPYSQFDTIKLRSNSMYSFEIILLDETKTPADSISKNISKAAEQHQFFFTIENNAPLTISYMDFDKNGVPVGLINHMMTEGPSLNKTGKIKVQLKHQGTEKPKTGNGNSEIGSTDIEVDFPLIIK